MEVDGPDAGDARLFSRRSLLFRVGAAMTGITVLAILSMLASVIIAQTAKGDAAAINLAGSLRMQSYRMANAIRAGAPTTELRRLAGDFTTDLRSDVLTGDIPDSVSHPLKQEYEKVWEQWRDRLRPAVLDGASRQNAYLAAVKDYVADVDRMVQLLQREAENKILLLRFIQGLALFLTLALVFFTMHRILTDVLPPLKDLLGVVDEARHGNLSARTAYRGDDEIGLLSLTFNRMAENLQAMYRDLEKRVADKTARLEQSNHALQLLYDTARTLSREPMQRTDYRDIIASMEKALDTGPIALCLSASGSERAYRRVTSGTEARPAFCHAPECAACLISDGISASHRVQDGVLGIPVEESGERYGALLVSHPKERPLEPWQLQLCETIAGHIATAQSLRRSEEDRYRLALMDERAVIARELHDSLAQALSYLKIQTSRLRTEVRKGSVGDNLEVDAIIDEIRDGLNTAYRQLRELLNTFRLRLTESGIEPALAAAVSEFANRGGQDIRLDFQLQHCPLTPNEELHVVQIVREALANVVQHSGARHADVSLATDEQGRVRVDVVDDGVGIPPQWERTNHYGTTIMQERARGLDGTVEFIRPDGGGTVVRLLFRPDVQRRGGSGSLISQQQ
ncbi:MAG: type IV pili methyl-accepting chemotaxis transducer N-terminal domain-containing protein [Ectothiorhodospiraceae bacterium]